MLFSWAHPSGLRQKHAAEASSIQILVLSGRAGRRGTLQCPWEPSPGIAEPIIPIEKLKPFGAQRLPFNGPDIFVRAFKSTSKAQQEQVCSNPAATLAMREAD